MKRLVVGSGIFHSILLAAWKGGGGGRKTRGERPHIEGISIT